MENKDLPVAVIGAGPVGLAAAAHLIKRQQPFILLEAGDTVAHNVNQWSHVRVFSPWKFNIDKAAAELLTRSGWLSPDQDALPTGKELYEWYFKPLASHALLKPFIRTGSKVISVGRKGTDKMKSKDRENLPFVIRVQQTDQIVTYEARAVIDATGTWQNPNPVGSGGIEAPGETENSENIFYGIPDVQLKELNRYKNKNVLVVGAGHSAINTIIELEKLQQNYPSTKIHWVLRKKNISEVYGGKENDALPARGELGLRIERLIAEDKLAVYLPFQIEEIRREYDKLTIVGSQFNKQFALSNIDEIIACTGSRPDLSFLREVRVDVDSAVESVPAIAELIDPNIHSCGTVRPHGEAELRQKEKDFYVVGMKSYGRAPTFLMATGYEQVRSVVAALSGDLDAAKKVELDLPETGVCVTGNAGGSCCGADSEPEKEKACPSC